MNVEEATHDLARWLSYPAVKAIVTLVRAILAESRPSSEPPATASREGVELHFCDYTLGPFICTSTNAVGCDGHTPEEMAVYDAGFSAGERAARLREPRFDCTECGPGVAADEDGCCIACGRDCVVVRKKEPHPPAPPPPASAEKCPTCGDKFPEFCSAKPAEMHGTGKAQSEKCPEPLPEVLPRGFTCGQGCMVAITDATLDKALTRPVYRGQVQTASGWRSNPEAELPLDFIDWATVKPQATGTADPDATGKT